MPKRELEPLLSLEEAAGILYVTPNEFAELGIPTVRVLGRDLVEPVYVRKYLTSKRRRRVKAGRSAP